MAPQLRAGSRGFAVAILVGLLVACGDDDGGDAATTTTAAQTTTESVGTTEPEVVTEALDLDLPRSVVYANVEITVRSVTLSNATPGSYLDDEPEAGDTDYAYVETTVEHELDDPGDRLDVDFFSLELADDSEIDAEEVDFVSTVTVEPGVATDFTFAFPVDAAAELTGAVLVVAEPDRAPARLPLDEQVEADLYPIALSVEGAGTAEFEGGCGNATGTFLVDGAEIDLDAGADHTFDAIEPNESKRAREGERWLRVTVQVVAQNGTCGGTIANDSAFRLVVDGLPTASLNRDNELLDDGAGTEFVWGWTVPVDAELVLQVGLADGLTVDVPIALPADA